MYRPGVQLLIAIASGGLVGVAAFLLLALAARSGSLGVDGDARPPGNATLPSASAAAAPASVIHTNGAILVAAGDIADCSRTSHEKTAALLERLPGTIATLGDHAYESGTPQEFEECYGPTWGRHKERTRPVPGNHDYGTTDAAGYFKYFGPAAGEPGEGWYTYDLGAWRIYALNSNCGEVDGCDAGSAQYEWLAADLANRPADCVLAYWHHARFSAGSVRRSTQRAAPFVEVLHQAGAEVILSANAHSYERFAPLGPSGGVDQEFGIRHFVVGTGGAKLRPLTDPLPGTEARNDTAHGVLVLALTPGAYAWEFWAADGYFRESGEGYCHDPPPPRSPAN